MVFVPGAQYPEKVGGRSHWFVVSGQALLLRKQGEELVLPQKRELASLGLEPRGGLYVGSLDGIDCFALDGFDVQPEPPFEQVGLRVLLSSFASEWVGVAGRAMQIATFAATHRRCGRCGAPTVRDRGEHSVRCEPCALSFYPRISPAIIVLVRRGARALLARAPRFPEGMYSALAGFVEAGESLEETLVREVREEVGIEVRDPLYFGSQPWPFPHSLMIAFVAQHRSGEIRVDGREIVDARWFSKEGLPRLPPRLSIARRLVESWLSEP